MSVPPAAASGREPRPTRVSPDLTTVTDGSSARHPHTAIGKVVAVIEALAEHDRLGALADVTGLAPSTTHRILGELADLGWAHVGDRTYTPGARLLARVARSARMTPSPGSRYPRSGTCAIAPATRFISPCCTGTWRCTH